MRGADQASVIRMKSDRRHIDVEPFRSQDDLRAGDGEFAEPARSEAAPDHNPRGPLPRLCLEKPAGDVSELLGKLLNRAVNDRSRLNVVAHQRSVERLLADTFGRLRAKRVLTRLSACLAPFLENVAERAPTGAVAEKAVAVLGLAIETFHLNRWKPRCAVRGDPGRRGAL